MTFIKGKLLALAIKYATNYLRRHPEVLTEVSNHIPGKIDNLVLEALAKLLEV
ncbi:hypothetical protein SEA_KOKO_12 [Mycobacterium phage Koko]|uniref:Uncharacterized protein n=1 Tax=Mycobacterium phage Koko TaxID=2047840 RepID=A0A2H4PDJ3_9CAUD|nr:hypothetical protein KIP56_gp102 [Mycobacterium phage Koko]ATW60302.1 hypothetical protein SEA_KOKO_12 [Mycobacterium phage Koko]